MIGSEDMAAQSILPYIFRLLDDESEDYIQNAIGSYIKSDERFIVESWDNHQLDGVYIYSYLFRENIFDYSLNEFKLIDTSKPVAVHFHINFSTNTLDIWSNKRNAQKLITALTLIFANKLILEPYEIEFGKSLLYLKKSNDISIGIVKVDDIILENEIIASCTFNLISHPKPFCILEKYSQRISKITIIVKSTPFESNEDVTTLSIFQSGAIVVYRNRDQLSSYVLEKIQNLIAASRR